MEAFAYDSKRRHVPFFECTRSPVGLFRLLLTIILPLFFEKPWERVATPIHSLQQVSMEGVEEVMESKPYGIDVSCGMCKCLYII
jgi:hypothetical protein